MNYDAYRELVRRLEAEAARDPRGYARRVALFGVLGYAYLFAVFGALLAVVAFSPLVLHGAAGVWIGLKLGLIALPIGLVLGRPLVTSFPRPPGIVLDRARVPQLFAAIDEVATALEAPRPDVVLLTTAYNCSVLQRPRLGILGWPENVLVLGLPMLETLSPARFRAVLAHELGHLAADHNTFAGRLHAISGVWQLLLQRLSARPGLVYRVLAAFFRWYGPRFQAMGFVLGRRQEYFADQCSRYVAGRAATRGALARIEVMARGFGERMNDAVRERMRDTSDAPPELYASVIRSMRGDLPRDQAKRWLGDARRTITGYEDTHPSLGDRLQAVDPSVAPTVTDVLAEPGPSAAEALLGAALAPITNEVAARWADDNAGAWRHRHGRVETLERVIEAEVGADLESAEAAWAALAARLELDGGRDAAPRLAAFVAEHPGHVESMFRLGHALLEAGEAKGLEALETAMQLDSDYVPGACRLALHFLRAQGRGPEADSYARRAWQFAQLEQQALDERRVLGPRDTLVPHGLPPNVVDALMQRLASEDWITAAYLVRRDVRVRPDKPCTILGVIAHRPWYKLVDPNAERLLARNLLNAAAIPEGTWIYVLEGNMRWARRRMARIEGARIWTRPRRRRQATAATETETSKAA